MSSQASLNIEPTTAAIRRTNVSTPIVLIAEELSPAGIAQLESGFELRYADGSDRSQLLPALVDADAVIIRSATAIDAEALEHAPRLRVIARSRGACSSASASMVVAP